MKIFLSPAKLMDYENTISTPFTAIAHFLEEADELAQKLKKLSHKEIGTLMNLSQSLSDVNYARYQNWEKPTQLGKNAQPAATVFNGEVYKGLDIASFSEEDFQNAQDSLLILSGLYGLLRPLDLMYPYRLEMGTRWALSTAHKNLYSYWKPKITAFLKQRVKQGEVIVNLASNEYFKVVDLKQVSAPVITPVFKELKGDKFKTIVMYAKHARGAMAREIIQQNIQDVEELKGYDKDGYSYSHEMSTEKEWVFIR